MLKKIRMTVFVCLLLLVAFKPFHRSIPGCDAAQLMEIVMVGIKADREGRFRQRVAASISVQLANFVLQSDAQVKRLVCTAEFGMAAYNRDTTYKVVYIVSPASKRSEYIC